MTIREMARAKGFEVVGRLKKSFFTIESYNYRREEWVTIKQAYWIDEAGNEYTKEDDGVCIFTADGGVL